MKDLFEKHIFGVCVWVGQKMGIRVSVIRLYFIYASFVTFGSPIILYLSIAFWLNLKKYLSRTKDLIYS